MFLRGGGVYQKVDLENARVGSSLDISGSTFRNAVVLRGATVEGDLRLARPSAEPDWQPGSALDLRAATVRGIDDTTDAWPATLQLTGFTYRLPAGAGSATGDRFINRSADWYRSWLVGPEFSSQPCEQLEAALRDVGRSGTADAVAIARRDREIGILRHAREFWRWTIAQSHRVSVRYGFRAERSLVWILGLWGLGFLVALRIPVRYHLANKVTSPLLFSFDRLIPLVTLHKPDRDSDLTDDAVPRWVRGYFHFQTIAGWVLAALFVTAIGRIAG